MNALVEGIVTAIIKVAAAFFKRSRTAVDGDVADSSLLRAGSRIRDWMQSRRAGVGVKPDQDRPIDKDAGVHHD